MLLQFIPIRILDVLDVLLVAFLLYQVYMLIKGTVAINIFIGIALIFIVWIIVSALDMKLLSFILGGFVGVGMITLIIVFQQEIRRFLLLIGTKYSVKNRSFSMDSFLHYKKNKEETQFIQHISTACEHMAASKTGALLVVSNTSELPSFSETGDYLNADISNRLIENIFVKNSPLHDGAVIISQSKIIAARCVLPLSEDLEIAPELGLRHRSALGMSKETEALVIVISEETGNISTAKSGQLHIDLTADQLKQQLRAEYY